MPGDGLGTVQASSEEWKSASKMLKGGKGNGGLPFYTLAEVGNHSSREDCWIVISGQVYDVTSWIPRHPGTEFPIMGCAGREATDAFLAFHPPQAFNILPKFLIGHLAASDAPPKMIVDYRELVQQITKAGLFNTSLRWYGSYWAMMLGVWLLVVAGVVYSRSTVVHVVCAALLGLFWNQCLFMGHDSGHTGITHISKIDRAIGATWTNLFAGIAMAWWQNPHNAHHITCNSVDYDPDIQQLPVFAMTTRYFMPVYSHYHMALLVFDRAAKFLISFQHLSFYPLCATLGRPNLYLQSFIVLLTRKDVSTRFWELSAVILFWSWFGGLLYALPNAKERLLFYAVSHAMVTFIHVQIVLSHSSSAAEKFEDRPGNYQWLRHHTNGTVNWSCPWWMDWFHGGLHYQIEHHLFPRMPRHNLRKVSGIVKDFCKKHGVEHRTVTFVEANVLLYRTLRKVAFQAREQLLGVNDSASLKELNKDWQKIYNSSCDVVAAMESKRR